MFYSFVYAVMNGSAEAVERGLSGGRPKDDGSRLLGLNQRIENSREAYFLGRRQESRLSTGLHSLRWLDLKLYGYS